MIFIYSPCSTRSHSLHTMRTSTRRDSTPVSRSLFLRRLTVERVAYVYGGCVVQCASKSFAFFCTYLAFAIKSFHVRLHFFTFFINSSICCFYLVLIQIIFYELHVIQQFFLNCFIILQLFLTFSRRSFCTWVFRPYVQLGHFSN